MALGLTAAAIERLAVEIRHLQRSEVAEVAEPFARAQKGSSAMPHKRNPVLAENLTGLARLVRAQLAPALENIVLWHERDISHSSVERALFPDTCALVDFALARSTYLIENLEVYPQRMAHNLEMSGGRIHSQDILLALVRAGLAREEAYRCVQKHAMQEDSPQHGDFLTRLVADPAISRHLTAQKLAQICDPEVRRVRLQGLFERALTLQEAEASA